MPQIISVQSLRHGTGKSNLVSNLAVSLAQEGWQVGIIDTGVRPPGIHSIFGLDDDQTDSALNAYLQNDDAPNPLPISDKLAYKIGNGQVIVIGGQVHLASINANLSDLSHYLQKDCDITALSQDFFALMERLKLDYLLIDSRPEINEENLFYMAIADVLMLVLCLDDQTFQGIAVTVDIARRLGVPKTLLVVNQLPSVFNAEEVQHQLEETFGESVAGVLPFSEEILQLAGRGVFSLQYPQHALTLEMQAIAYRLMHLDFSMPHTVPNLFNSEVLQQTANNIHVGLTMFEALNLPDSHRQIVNWVMRQGAASLQEIARSVGQSETNVSAILGILTEQGFIEPIDIQGQLCFRLRFTTKQNRQLSEKIWHPLQDDKPE